MSDTKPHLCRNRLSVAICASNGIGPARFFADLQCVERCAICGRWWKLYASSPYLTIWAELPEWMVRLFQHKAWKTEHVRNTK